MSDISEKDKPAITTQMVIIERQILPPFSAY